MEEKKTFEMPVVIQKDTYQSSAADSTAASSWECKPGGIMAVC